MKTLIIIALITILIGFGIQQVYGESHEIVCKEGVKTIIECLIYGIYQTQLIIIEQNNIIIDNQEWIKCAFSEHDSGWYAVERYCGEMP